MAVTIQLNGQMKTLTEGSPGMSVEALLVELELKVDRVAVECNGEIVPREQRGSVSVGDGDRIEIVHFVGGGAD